MTNFVKAYYDITLAPNQISNKKNSSLLVLIIGIDYSYATYNLSRFSCGTA